MKTIITVIATMIISGMVVSGAVLFLGADWGAEKAAKESKNAAAAAMQAMSFTQDMHDRLGTPFTMGEVTIQKTDIQFMGTSTLQLTIMVSGPNGSGKASCTVVKPRGEKFWTMTNGMFFPTSGPPIMLKVRAAPSSGGGGGASPSGLPGFNN